MVIEKIYRHIYGEEDIAHSMAIYGNIIVSIYLYIYTSQNLENEIFIEIACIILPVMLILITSQMRIQFIEYVSLFFI